MDKINNQRKIRYDTMIHQVKILSEEITNLTDQPPNRWLMTLKKNTKYLEDNRIKIKLGKFRCDLNDYYNNKIFSWKHSNQRIIPSLIDINPSIIVTKDTAESLTSTPTSKLMEDKHTLSLHPAIYLLLSNIFLQFLF